MAKQGFIYINGVISPTPADGFFFCDPTCGEVDVRNQLSALAEDIEEVVVSINSPGGSIDEGFAIANTLKTFGKKITTRATGTCASIATIIFCAGSKRQIFSNSQLMVHNPIAGIPGMAGAEELQKYADQLKAEEARILDEYVAITGADRDTLSTLMADETYIKADQALELKFATEILQPVMAIHKRNIMSQKTNAAKNAFKALAQFLNLTDEPVNMVEMTTTDGKIITFDPEMSVGSTATIDAQPAPDNSYELEDGTVVVCVGGKVESITTPASDNKELEAANAKIAELTAQLEALNTEKATLANEIETLKTENSKVAGEVTKITESLRALNVQIDLPAGTVVFNQGGGDPNGRMTMAEYKAKMEAKKNSNK